MAVDRHRKDQRRLQAYVEVPSRTKSLVQRESHSDTGGDIDMSSTSPPPHKRKLSRPEADTSAELKKQKLTENDTNTLPPKTATEDEDMGNDGEVSSGDLKPPKKTTSKKIKTANPTKLGAAGATSSSKPSNASEEFPNGHLYCHQCNKKRDVSQVISCTEAANKCRTKYCKPCLSNRYGEDIEEIKKSPPCGAGKTKMPYTFRCPKCQGTCNCRTCRRAQGLEPTGNLTNAARKVGISAAELLEANPDQKGILPGQVQERKRIKAAENLDKKTKPVTQSTSKAPAKPRKPRPKPAKPLIPVIQPMWTKLSNVPPEITVEHLEERMFIREFMNRFSPLMPKEAKIHLDELGEIIGDGSVDWVVNETQPKKGKAAPDIPLVSWVSEKCIRSVVFGLLGIYVEDAAGHLKTSLRTALEEIEKSSANMTKIWGTLVSLRHEYPNDFTYPDPLPPPTTMQIYNTRRGAIHQGGIPVGHSAQLVHVVLDLIEGLMTRGSKTLKAEMDRSGNEVKDIMKRGKEAIAKENEQWKKEKTRIGTTKSSRPSKDVQKSLNDAHETRVDDLEKAQLTLISSFTSRFSSLGRDDEGRQYFAFSPSLTEREAAEEIISYTEGGRGRRGTVLASGSVRTMDESKREELWNWDWFVAVRGRRPADATVAPDLYQDEYDGDTTDDEDGKSERWWAFWRPEDIRNLSGWIAYRHGLEHEGDDHDFKGEKIVPHVARHKTSNGLLVPPTGTSTTSSTADALSESSNLNHDAMKIEETDNENTDTDGIPGEGSPLTDFDESEDESGIKKLMDFPQNGKPSRKAVEELISALSGYAQLLEWRVQRGERERKARQRD